MRQLGDKIGAKLIAEDRRRRGVWAGKAVRPVRGADAVAARSREGTVHITVMDAAAEENYNRTLPNVDQPGVYACVCAARILHGT